MSSNNGAALAEQIYQNDQTYFFDHISKFLGEKLNVSEESEFNQILKSQIPIMNDDNYSLLGSLAYLIGLDFVQQSYYTKEVSNNVIQRLTPYIPEDEKTRVDFIKSLLECVHRLNSENISECNESLKNKVEGVLSDAIDVSKILYTVNKIISSSYVDVKYAVSISDIMRKTPSQITYKDILTINNIVNNYCKFKGKNAMNTMSQLYSSKEWLKALNTARSYFDLMKFSIIFFDSIVSLKEHIITRNQDYDTIVKAITNSMTDEEFLKDKEDHSPDNDSKEVQQTDELNYTTLQPEETEDKLANHPFEALLYWTVEQLNISEKDLNAEKLLQSLHDFSDEPEFFGDLYKYVKVKANEPVIDLSFDNDKYNSLNIDEFRELLKNDINELMVDYDKLARSLCSEVTNSTMLNRIINDTISSLVMEPGQSRQYLMSQFYEPGINTYQQMIQILNLIEGSSINGDDLKTYVELNKLIEREHGDKIEEFQQITPVFNKLSFNNELQRLLTPKPVNE